MAPPLRRRSPLPLLSVPAVALSAVTAALPRGTVITQRRRSATRPLQWRETFGRHLAEVRSGSVFAKPLSTSLCQPGRGGATPRGR